MKFANEGRTLNIRCEHAKDHQVPSRWSCAHPPRSEVQSNCHLHVSLQRKWIHSTPNYLVRQSCDWDAARFPTLRVFSTSPQGSLFTKSMPVRGVPVGGNSTEASIIRYSTFKGLLCNRRVHGRADAPLRSEELTSPEGKHVSVNEDPLTVMLLYSSSNMSRKISSPWDEFKRRRSRKSLTDHSYWDIYSYSQPPFWIVTNIKTTVDRTHDNKTNIILKIHS